MPTQELSNRLCCRSRANAQSALSPAPTDRYGQRPRGNPGAVIGGGTAITVAALNPPNVQAAINFAGGSGGEPEGSPQKPCAASSLKRMFASYGKTARTPTLWVYTENDMFFGPKLPKEWFDAFKAAGSTGEFALFPANGNDGHGLFVQAPDVWKPRVLEFLKANGYPALVAPEAPAKP